MKRTQLKRGKPITRKKPMRKAPPRRRTRPSPERDDVYMEKVRQLRCRVEVQMAADQCRGPIEAHHAGPNPGVALKASDRTCVPMCSWHHQQFTDHFGVFRGWTRTERRSWSDAQIAAVQALIDHVAKRDGCRL